MPATNPILRIPGHRDFQVPVHFSDGNEFGYTRQLKKQFQKIRNYLQSCSEASYQPAIKTEVIDRVRAIQDSILMVLDNYLKGHPSQAYHLFTDLLERYQVKNEISSLQQFKSMRNSFFFRTQKRPETEPVPAKYRGKAGFINFKQPSELFHTPFQKRKKIGSNRFSISGYPCLYLSETILTSFSECFPNTGEFGDFNVVCFKNNRPLYFLDLSLDGVYNNPLLFSGPLNFGSSPNQDASSVIDYLGIYQLILASHTKIDYQKKKKEQPVNFKAEYIIPQMLLQWLKEEGQAIDGIRYKSCTGSVKFPGKKTNHFNYVLPVKSNLNKGFCLSLKKALVSTKVYSYFGTRPRNIKALLQNITEALKGSAFQSLK